MHFEILAEDQSGKKTLDILVPNIIGDEHTFRVISYKGIGRIPNLRFTKQSVQGNYSPVFLCHISLRSSAPSAVYLPLAFGRILWEKL